MAIARIRAFNRYYARVLGIFDRKYLGVDFSVTEVRILGELGRGREVTAKKLADFLGIDKGYLSRVLHGLEKRQLIARSPSEKDGRERYLKLTEAGEALNRELEDKADRRIREQVERLDSADYEALLEAMDKLQELLRKAMPDLRESL